MPRCPLLVLDVHEYRKSRGQTNKQAFSPISHNKQLQMWERDPTTSVSHISGRHTISMKRMLGLLSSDKAPSYLRLFSCVCNKSTLGASPDIMDLRFLVAGGQNSRTIYDVLRNNKGLFKWDQTSGFTLRLYARCNNGEAYDFIHLIDSMRDEMGWDGIRWEKCKTEKGMQTLKSSDFWSIIFNVWDKYIWAS